MVRGSTPSRTSARRIGTSNLPGLPAHSRTVWDTEAWKRTLVGLGSTPGAFTASVAAPERTVTLGHSRFGSGPAGAVAATFSWPVELPAEKRFFPRWVTEPLEESLGDDEPMMSKDEQPAAARNRISIAARAAPRRRGRRPTC